MNPGLGRVLRQYRELWHGALSHNASGAQFFIALGVALGLGFGALAGGVAGGPRGAFAGALGAVLGTVMLGWVIWFVHGAVKMNTPANARLVPALRRRLIELASLVWALCLAGLALAIQLIGEDAGLWVLVIGCFSLGAALEGAGERRGSILTTLGLLCLVFDEQVLAWGAGVFGSPPFVAALMAVFLLLGPALIAAMLPQAGERHFRMQAARQRLSRFTSSTEQLGGRRLQRLVEARYGPALQRDLGRRDPGRLMRHAFNGAAGMLDQVVSIAVIFVVGVGAIVLTHLLGGEEGVETMRGVGWILAATVILVPMFHAGHALRLLRGSAAEQGVVRLAPLMPARPRAFNRRLATVLLTETLGGWTLGALAALALGLLSGAAAQSLAIQFFLCCLALPMSAVVLRDHARDRPVHAVLMIVLLACAGLASVALGAILNEQAGWPLMPAAGVCAIVIALLALWRGWVTMLRAPIAFPAGRIA
jgi:hypothetical protein